MTTKGISASKGIKMKVGKIISLFLFSILLVGIIYINKDISMGERFGYISEILSE